jgi:hypothetical protein
MGITFNENNNNNNNNNNNHQQHQQQQREIAKGTHAPRPVPTSALTTTADAFFDLAPRAPPRAEDDDGALNIGESACANCIFFVFSQHKGDKK